MNPTMLWCWPASRRIGFGIATAYEFLERLDSSGPRTGPATSKQRGAVFRFPGHCQRVDVVYNPLLKRYLLALGYNSKGGWGIYDAPEPWGPWTTAFHTDYWGMEGTHGYRLPANGSAPMPNDDPGFFRRQTARHHLRRLLRSEDDPGTGAPLARAVAVESGVYFHRVTCHTP